ncbi:hypothetical protein E4U52_006304 [Claviceps spartinae]|nr:hypothetical protein E4U52_006304 [Claviceps spartinae]
MNYFFKKAVESVKKRRRSRDEVATDAMIEKNLHLAARNCILNVAPTHTWSVTSKDLADFHASPGVSAATSFWPPNATNDNGGPVQRNDACLG